jgi:histidinol-phosphate aminotransferase
MYRVCADIQGVPMHNIPMSPRFDLDADDALQLLQECTKVMLLCSPNNPTGNSLKESEVLKLAESFEGLVVIDEAYIDFSPHSSYTRLLGSHPNLIVLQTLSKAWGLAGIRMGIAVASAEIIRILDKIKYPYNINALSMQKAMEALANHEQMKSQVADILDQRTWMKEELRKFEIVEEIYPSDANFLLARFTDPQKIYAYLLSRDIVVRDRSKVPGLDGCLRLTVGTQEENIKLITALKSL